MAKIGLSEGFSVIPEGTYVFKITKVNYKEDFGKMEVHMETQDGQKHIERFSLLDAKGNPNDGAMKAFSYFARAALGDTSLMEIDHEDLLGNFIECDVEHDIQPNKNNPDKTVTFVRFTDKRASDGWDEEETPAPKPKAAPKAPPAASAAPKTTGGKKPSVDLKALLGA